MDMKNISFFSSEEMVLSLSIIYDEMKGKAA